MATEKLKFSLELYAVMWDKPPHAAVYVNDVLLYDSDITGTKDNPTQVEFEHEVGEGKSNHLTIVRTGKGTGQTVVGQDGQILKDQLLGIKNIEIDEINIGALVYSGEYTPDYPEPWASQQRESGNDLPVSFKNVTEMGHDGSWRLGFESPFYMWLLENLY